MTMNRVQFQPGCSMSEFMGRCASDDKCETALIESRWPDGFAWPGVCLKGAATAMHRPTATAPHLDSTECRCTDPCHEWAVLTTKQTPQA